MIQAEATQFPGFLRLEIIHPEQNEPVIKQVATEAEGLRLIYFMNRNYMLKKLRSWLKQRQFGHDPKRSIEAAKLLVLLGYYNQLSFPALCRVISKHRKAIEDIAPRESTRFYNHYVNTIVPLLNDAAEIGGAK